MPKVYFRNGGADGAELWASDGTASGTALLADISPGSTDSYPADLTLVGSKLYFVANDGTHGNELWISDGTSGGTKLVNDGRSGAGSSIFDSHSTYVNATAEQTAFGGKTYFLANSSSGGRLLYWTTGSGATLVSASMSVSSAGNLTAVGSKLFLSSVSSGLYVLTGLDTVTHITAPFSTMASDLVAMGSKVYFTAYDATHAFELWVSDGTNAGTKLVKDINTVNTSYGSFPGELTVAGSKLFFAAQDNTHGYELWVTSGTSSGTHMVKDISSGADGGLSTYFDGFTAVGSKIYFAAYEHTHGEELWVSDGTSSGTHMVKDLTPGAARTPFGETEAVGSTLFFTASTAGHGMELWRTDGTSAGTVLVKDIVSGSDPSMPSDLTAVGASLYFTAWDATGREGLWRTDGTAIGTVELSSVTPAFNVTPQGDLIVFDGKLWFSGKDDFHGAELWSSDGTVDGTNLFKDIAPTFSNNLPYDGDPNEFVIVDGKMYFDSFAQGPALWVTDGTTGGTTDIFDFGNTVYGLTAFGDDIVFGANTAGGKFELWISDGTHDGTHMIKAISGDGTGGPSDLTVVGDKLFFVTDDGVNGSEIWVTDGTDVNTHLVQNIIPIDPTYQYQISSPGDLTAVGDRLFFTANDGTNGKELWSTDGTTAAMVKDIYPGSTPGTGISSGPHSSNPDNLMAVGDKLYFSASDGDFSSGDGNELWVSDGTDVGTHMVKDIRTGAGSGSNPITLGAFGDRLVFTASDADGKELWITDGTDTDSGTYIIKDLPVGTSVYEIAAMGDAFYFTAETGDGNTYQLWRSDGTEGNATMIKSLGSGSGQHMTVDGDTLYFTAQSLSGPSIWKSDGTTEGTSQITSAGSLGQITAGIAAATGSASDGANRINDSSSSHTIHAKNGDDFVNGASGNDKLYGDSGNDTLLGGSGKDHIEGSSGNDWLEGGADQDTLIGGSGKDNFVFDTAPVKSKPDTISGFDRSDDTLVFAHSVFTKVAPGSLSTTSFVSASHAKAHDGDDFFLFDTSNKTLYYDADGNGHGAAIAIAVFTHGENPTASDILIV